MPPRVQIARLLAQLREHELERAGDALQELLQREKKLGQDLAAACKTAAIFSGELGVMNFSYTALRNSVSDIPDYKMQRASNLQAPT